MADGRRLAPVPVAARPDPTRQDKDIAMSENPVLPLNDQNLIWIDLEMTGLFPDKDRIIEIAVVVTTRS